MGYNLEAKLVVLYDRFIAQLMLGIRKKAEVKKNDLRIMSFKRIAIERRLKEESMNSFI